MEMKSMELPKKPVEKMMSEPEPMDQPRYPWGLSITLGEEVLKMLDVKELPSVGGSVMISAEAKVEAVSVNESSDKKQHRRVELQIIKMALNPPEKKVKDVAKELYGDK